VPDARLINSNRVSLVPQPRELLAPRLFVELAHRFVQKLCELFARLISSSCFIGIRVSLSRRVRVRAIGSRIDAPSSCVNCSRVDQFKSPHRQSRELGAPGARQIDLVRASMCPAGA
jgi:hypothetical protein